LHLFGCKITTFCKKTKEKPIFYPQYFQKNIRLKEIPLFVLQIDSNFCFSIPKRKKHSISISKMNDIYLFY